MDATSTQSFLREKPCLGLPNSSLEEAVARLASIGIRSAAVQRALQEQRDHEVVGSSTCQSDEDREKRAYLEKRLEAGLQGKIALHAWQKAAALDLLMGRSCVLTAATGSGKSMVFTAPLLALEAGEVGIIVVPLNAIGDDQTTSMLERFDIKATFVNSKSRQECRNVIQAALADHETRALLLSPETLLDDAEARRLLHGNTRVRFIAIDEAHLLDTWSDFRPAFGRLGDLSLYFGEVPIALLSATLSPKAHEAIRQMFGSKSVSTRFEHIRRPLNRANIFWALTPIDGPKSERRNLFVMFTHMDTGRPVKSAEEIPKGLVYQERKSEAQVTHDRMLDMLGMLGISAYGWDGDEETGRSYPLVAVYNADVDAEQKETILADYAAGRTRIVIATDAFGMGVDCKHVRRVLCYDFASREGFRSELTSLVQRIGRAVRDPGEWGIGIIAYPAWAMGESVDVEHMAQPHAALVRGRREAAPRQEASALDADAQRRRRMTEELFNLLNHANCTREYVCTIFGGSDVWLFKSLKDASLQGTISCLLLGGCSRCLERTDASAVVNLITGVGLKSAFEAEQVRTVREICRRHPQFLQDISDKSLPKPGKLVRLKRYKEALIDALEDWRVTVYEEYLSIHKPGIPMAGLGFCDPHVVDLWKYWLSLEDMDDGRKAGELLLKISRCSSDIDLPSGHWTALFLQLKQAAGLAREREAEEKARKKAERAAPVEQETEPANVPTSFVGDDSGLAFEFETQHDAGSASHSTSARDAVCVAPASPMTPSKGLSKRLSTAVINTTPTKKARPGSDLSPTTLQRHPMSPIQSISPLRHRMTTDLGFRRL